MKVELLRYTPNPEITCALAAQTSYSPKPPSLRKHKMTLGKAREILRRVIGYGHVSIIEHASFTFSLEDVNRVLEIQLVRHRLASYTIKSGRYNKSHCDIVIPPKIAENERAVSKIDKFVDYKDQIEYVTLFFMGEPLLDKTLPEKIKYSKDAGFRGLNIATNLALLTEETSKKLLDSGLDTIIFSIDGVKKETHEQIRQGVTSNKLSRMPRHLLNSGRNMTPIFFSA